MSKTPRHPRLQHRCMLPALALATCLIWGQAAAQTYEELQHPCGPVAVPGHYGPYDFRTQKRLLIVVEGAHFTPAVEALIRGSTGDLNKDLNYTLKSSPNHHRALISITRLANRLKTPAARGFDWSFECYFNRAIRFRPDDTVVRFLYAQFLAQNQRVDEASAQIEVGVKLDPENAFTQYNAGLLFLELGKMEQALAQAHRAQQLGHPGTELREKLIKAGRWQDPPP